MNIRAMSEGDFDAALRLLREDEEQLFGRSSRLERNDLRQWLSLSELATDTWLFEDEQGLVALGWMTPWGEVMAAIGVVHPRAKGRGIGSQLIETSEARARDRGVSRMQQIGLGADLEASKLISGRGYREIRRFYEMAIELEAAPEVPSGVAVDIFREEDAHAFHAAFEEAFQDHWGHHTRTFDEWWKVHRSSPNFDPTLWFVVRDGGEIVGAVRNEANRNGGGYVGALGVRRAWRGRGFARALLLRTFAELYARGFPRITLGVDAESPTGATRLYESVGMEVEMENVVYERTLE